MSKSLQTYAAFKEPSPYDRERQKAEQLRRYAELLQQQSLAQDEPFTYQGFRAMPSPAAALGKLLQAYGSKKASEKAAETEEKARLADIEGFEALRKDLGPQQQVAPPDMFGDPMEMGSKYTPPTMQTVMPTFQQQQDRLTQAMATGTPAAQRYAQLMLTRQPQVGIEAIMEASPESRKKYRETGDPFELAKPTKAPEMPSDVQSYEYYVQQERNAGRQPKSFEQFKTSQRASTNITNVLPGDKTRNVLSDEFAKGMATQDLKKIEMGDAALAQIETANNVRDLLEQNPITGFGANARLGLEKALAGAGFVKGDRASITENLSATLAKTTLATIRSSGLGSGQGFTDKDREFLEKAAAGTLEMSNENLRYLADLNDKAARANIAVSNKTRQRYRKLPNFANMPDMLPDITPPPVYGQRQFKVLR